MPMAGCHKPRGKYIVTGGFLLLGPAARLVLLRRDLVQVHFHVLGRVVVFSADMLLFPVKQTHDHTPAPAPGLVP